MTLKEVLRITDRLEQRRPNGIARRACEYCQGMRRTYRGYGIPGIETQLKYILTLLRYWRGEEARSYKALLQEILEEGITE